MRARLLQFWENLRSSFWLVPSLMALAAVALSAGTVAIDAGPTGKSLVNSVGWLWSGGAEGARSLLSTVASSMITVTGTVFSITIAALTLASSQFGPRLLRNFTRDTGNRVVLGTFVATFLYCLLVLRTVRSAAESAFVPYLSVTCGVLLAATSVGVLIYFIHHVAASIQAEGIAAAVATELKSDIARLSPPAPPGPGDAAAAAPIVLPHRDPCPVVAIASGYVQSLDRGGLFEAAEEGDLLIRVLRRPGDFTFQGECLLEVWGPQETLANSDCERLRGCFGLGSQRTPAQDVRYGVRQLTEIAARALSPGINDPFTAMTCADWLADALAEMARRNVPSGIRRGACNKVRILEEPVSFAAIVHLGFEPFRVYGSDSAIVMVHVFNVLARLAQHVESSRLRLDLLNEARRIADTVRTGLIHDIDKHAVEVSLEQIRKAATV